MLLRVFFFKLKKYYYIVNNKQHPKLAIKEQNRNYSKTHFALAKTKTTSDDQHGALHNRDNCRTKAIPGGHSVLKYVLSVLAIAEQC